MFKQNDAQNSDVETIIGPSVTVEGNFNGNGNVIIEGSVIGSLKTDGQVRIGSDAKVKAEISGARILVSGEVRGNIVATDSIELTSSARVTGNISTKLLSIESGAMFQGKSAMGSEQTEVRQEKTEHAKKNSGRLKQE